MWIGFLGPLQVVGAAGDVPVRPAKHRSLLAALAARAGNVVSVDSLAETIWDSRPPTSWRVTLRTYVMRLREALGPADGARIVAVPSGYLLNATSDELDLLRFETLCSAGLAAERAGDWRRAASVLADGERLWRGVPFADIPSRGAHDAYMYYLEEKRFAALEARIRADVRLSLLGAAHAIPDLRRLVAIHPERERLRGLLMLALYRAGRQAEAFGVFRDARTFTTTELGVEPDRVLVEGYRQMLAADTRLLNEPLNDHQGLVLC
jgi:DNA-binding SARP family transcriptional activator